MIITQNMLKNWIEIPENILELTNQKIIEVENFEMLNTSTNLVVGKVLTCTPHPNSDHLNLTTVDLGDRIEKIVCGAPNVAKDQYVIVAQVGSVLPGDFVIKKSVIRGEESNGMICSLKELGIDESLIPDDFSDGIYNFNSPKKIGSHALEALSLEGWTMTLGLTPNRGDLLSIYGFALDLGSLTNQKVKEPKFNIVESSKENKVKVEIKTEGCLRYHAREFSNLNIKESPWWLKSALLAHDIKPINNVVDISNYVLIEYGTPLHMFDQNKVKTDHIIVRDANEGEKVTTLDEVKRVLSKDDVVITNGLEVIAIGGVMGLENSMIDDQTTQVILEAALFDPKQIAKTSKRLNLKSDSSLRFERGIDENRVIQGLERASELLVELADAVVSKGITTVIKSKQKHAVIKVDKNYFNESLGVDIKEKELLTYFKNYHYEVKQEDNIYIITPPTYRLDLEIDADILEEVARMFGLNNIPMTKHLSKTSGSLTHKQKLTRSFRHDLAAIGLNEIISYTLIDPNDVYRYAQLGKPVSILMPLSEDKKTLRQSLAHGLLQTIAYNQKRQMESVHIFEIGHVFAQGLEKTHIGIAMSGVWHQSYWQKESLKTDFYVLKGILDKLTQQIGINLTYQASDVHEKLHPYRQADILLNDKVIGYMGQVHPSEQKALDINQTYIAELDFEELLKTNLNVEFETISKYPNISRDLAIVVDQSISAQSLKDMIAQTLRKQLVSLHVFDVYEGSHIQKGMKSIAFNLVFNDPTKTLETDEVDKMMKKVISRLSYEFKAEVRK
ncbi:MAG: phenylalanine--tRNA ligase subunit beta [Acholeplasmataceae bacterium]|nr:phenylalanine--tRNA ligase subunit beta [Acholeplasmataceae bacterium]